MADLQNGMPPGWDSKFDEKSGKYYFVNHFTRTTTWEDPRVKHRPLQGTPRHLAKVPVEHIPLQDMKTSSRSPFNIRSAKIQDSSFAGSHSSTDSDDSVAKISAMFPTVSETHIKLLLKNCRYMKSIFPNADEMIILECLQNNESSIQKTSEMLREMGYSKKTLKQATPKVEHKTVESKDVTSENARQPTPVPKIKTSQEKQQMKEKLQKEYTDVPDHLISIALESVNFNEDRANQILKIMKQEDNESKSNNENKKIEPSISVPDTSVSPNPVSQLPISQSRQSIKSLLKNSEKKDDGYGFSRIISENSDLYRSKYLSNTLGHNHQLSRGPNDKLLLENYVQWQGPNKSIQKGSQTLAKGPNKNLLSAKLYTPCGPNAELRRGPSFGLTKGSIFSQIKAVIVGESRVE